MKTPQAMIRERAGAALLAGRAKTAVFCYVRPRKDGEATLEYWGARKHRGKVKCRCFFRFRTDRDRYAMRDIVYYNSWSPLCPSHICYNFPEAGSRDYMAEVTNGPYARKWTSALVSKTEKCFLPFATMLNDFAGTRYRYCGFDPNCGMFALDYLRFWERHPKAEILSKAGCFRLLTDSFMRRIEGDRAFERYVAKYHAAIAEHAIGARDIRRGYRDGRDLNQYAALLREAERRRAEAEGKALRERLMQYDEAIRALYEKVKDICATYGAYEVIVPQSSEEMLAEGEAMHNCVGQCYAKSQGRDNICVFLHRDGKACVDIRIDLKTFALVECRAVCNKQADDSAWEVAREVAERVRARLAA